MPSGPLLPENSYELWCIFTYGNCYQTQAAVIVYRSAVYTMDRANPLNLISELPLSAILTFLHLGLRQSLSDAIRTVVRRGAI